ncbi:xanthine dehydrogenase family protein molybdopterin-binding subunit [Sphingobium boeckii]|uniref:Carbon-monoxide dehydrogenase large subunit n=1 Tax=Sphingobium boeckii TaxID=1082345 RepID=A0A7W9EED9_9SPHN|nr:xanthine dehydrogenase family protein molybdopterin-binding subunit [Sphingobium boeckii]MBB5685924.1 carbon-monoxide dehydrogenase large subunit [Sphingobium boeckii]
MNPTINAARFIGQRVPRKEDHRLLTGRGTFVDDVVVAGMLHVAFLRSPIARGRILSFDTAAARAMPGVHAILTAADLSALKIDMLSFFLAPAEIAITPLADGRVAYVGEPVVMVIAVDRYVAEDATSLIEIDYDEEDPVVTIDDARTGAPVHPGMDSNVAAAMGEDEINEPLEALLRDAPHLISGTITHQRIAQSPMETRGVIVSPQGSEEIIVYITCASPHLIARNLSMAFNLPNTNFRVIAKDVGGSFGLKNQPWKEEMAVIAAGILLGRPLKWIEDRWENLTGANQAREQEMTLRIAFDNDGKLLASHADYHLNNGAYPHGADCNIAVVMFLWSAYKIPEFSFQTQGWFSNTAGLAAYRGPWAIETLAREVLLDEAARKIGIDPIEIRRRNLITRADQPMVASMGIPIDDISPMECLDKLLEVVDVAAFRIEQEAARKEGRYLGIGFATYIEPTGAAGSINVMTGELAHVQIEPTGKVTAIMSTHSQGHGTQTTMAQIFAEELGVPFEDVTVHEGDSSRGGFSPGAAGSRQGVIGGGASIKAAGLLRDKIKKVAAHLLNANPDDVTIEGGMVRVRGAEEMTRSLRQIAEIAYGEPDRLPPGMESGLEAQYRYNPPPMTFTSAAHACIVEIDAETGFVKIKRWVSSEDCGVMINPAIVEGQISGGLAQAIGTVLLEEFGYDDRGNPTTVTFKDYMLPAISDVPDFEFVHANTPSQAEGGFRGVGEGGCIIGPPTLVNAIADALSPFNARCLDLPLTPSKILQLMEGKDISRAAQRQVKSDAAAAAAAAKAVAEKEVHIGSHGEGLPPMAAAMLPGGADAAALEAESTESEVHADGSATEAAPPSSPAGDWDCVMSTPMGPQTMKLHFDIEGDAVTGYTSSPDGTAEFTGIALGNQIKFDLKVTKPMKITLKYDIAIEGDVLAGKVKMGLFGTAKLKGSRAE